MDKSPSLSLAKHSGLTITEKLGLAILGIGLLALLTAAFGPGSSHSHLCLAISLGGVIVGSGVYILRSQQKAPPGIRNNGLTTSSMTSRGAWGWLTGIILTGIYTLYYWFPDTLVHLTRMTDPLSLPLRGKSADPWFMYSLLYTVTVLIMGYRALLKYRHTKYQKIRTYSVMASQLVFAFLIPAFLKKLNEPEEYISYFWPLNPKPLWPEKFAEFLSPDYRLGTLLLGFGIFMTFVATPLLTYFYGKRWYCSWVCGCGGLANTAGDNWRQLSNKSLMAWKIERWTIHSVLIFVVVTTILLWVDAKMGMLGNLAHPMKKVYGFLVIAAFAGVVGVGFYPLLGSRVWCRYGCPMAAILGLIQRKKSRFRITTNGAQCISCGNCSKYCEMGIDVRWYAQRGQDIVRSSCVGCGMCSTVCPRGVLNLENGPPDTRKSTQLSLLPKSKAGVESIQCE